MSIGIHTSFAAWGMPSAALAQLARGERLRRTMGVYRFLVDGAVVVAPWLIGTLVGCKKPESSSTATTPPATESALQVQSAADGVTVTSKTEEWIFIIHAGGMGNIKVSSTKARARVDRITFLIGNISSPLYPYMYDSLTQVVLAVNVTGTGRI